VRATLERLSGNGGLAKAYLGLSFLLITVLVVLLAAGQVTSARQEEASSRVEHLLVRPVSKFRWMLSRLMVGGIAVLTAGLLGGIFAWLGAAAQHTGLRFSALVSAGLNTVPAGVCLLGIGAMAWALAPRQTSAVVYGVVAWSFLVELLAGIVGSNHWLLDTSIFHQLAPAPAESPDWVSGTVMIGIGIVLGVIGAAWFSRRDLAGD
jgi:ABC-2 type transport system permease protein